MPNEKKLVGTIDMTPTWEGLLPGLLLAIENGTAEGRRIAREELARMAQVADLYVASRKPPRPLGATENIGSIVA